MEKVQQFLKVELNEIFRQNRAWDIDWDNRPLPLQVYTTSGGVCVCITLSLFVSVAFSPAAISHSPSIAPAGTHHPPHRVAGHHTSLALRQWEGGRQAEGGAGGNEEAIKGGEEESEFLAVYMIVLVCVVGVALQDVLH